MLSFSLIAHGPHSAVRALAHARKRLLSRVGEAAAASDQEFPALFTLLVAEIEAAFRHEETLMEAAGCPGLREQRRDNALLLAALHHTLPQVEAGEPATARAAVAALRPLLSLHRFSALRVLATGQRTLLTHRRGRAAGAARAGTGRERLR